MVPALRGLETPFVLSFGRLGFKLKINDIKIIIKGTLSFDVGDQNRYLGQTRPLSLTYA